MISLEIQKKGDVLRSIEYPTLRDVLDIHQEIMRLSGESGGILNIGNLEFALDHIRYRSYSADSGDIFAKCAILGRAIIQGHPFIDGNKRTGIEVIEFFMNLNGLVLRTNVESGVEFTLNVATGSLSLKEMREWIATHSEENIKNEGKVEEPRVNYMTEKEPVRTANKRENPYDLPEERIALIDAGIKKNRKLLEELAKY